MTASSRNGRVAIVGGARTPFAKAGGVLERYTALDLGVHAVDGLLETTGLLPGEVGELAFGIVVVDPRMPQMGREVAFASRLEPSVRAFTLTDNCITGARAMAWVHGSIAAGRIEVGIAGGVESMSNPPVLFGRAAAKRFRELAAARTMGARLAAFLRLRPGHFWPDPPAIAEPSTGLTMGEHAELMAKEWEISRETQDEIALRSHQRAHAATEDGRLQRELVVLDGVDHDTLVRSDTSLEKLAKLRPVFDRSSSGTITAGNSSPLTDGAAAVLLMSEERAHREGREPLAFVRDFEFAGIDPADGLLMGPAIAAPRLLGRHGLVLDDIDVVEMHEAFGAQVACNLAAWERGWKEPAIGAMSPERLNPLGSSIAVGHPFAATGARIATTLANEMARRDAKRGLISICGAGATAVAMLLERD
jgi:acetyl-CoA acetyltransferase family protein